MRISRAAYKALGEAEYHTRTAIDELAYYPELDEIANRLRDEYFKICSAMSKANGPDNDTPAANGG